MIMRRIIIIAILLCSLNVNGAFAIGDDDKVYVLTKSNLEATYPMDEISKITFSDKGVQLWSTSWPTEYSYENIRVLVVKSSSNSASSTEVVKPHVSNSNEVMIYDLQGCRRKSLQHGVNIIKMKDGKTKKIIIR